jgi:hypothetical protein
VTQLLGGTRQHCFFGHATHHLPCRPSSLRASRAARTESRKSGARIFTPMCSGVAACCDFGILATPDERGDGFQRTRRGLYQLRLWHCWCRNVESPRARVVANGVDYGGIAPCCDFGILATPAERGEASSDEGNPQWLRLKPRALARATSKASDLDIEIIGGISCHQDDPYSL